MISTQEWYDALRTDSIKVRVLRAMCKKAKAIWRKILIENPPTTEEAIAKSKVAMSLATEIIEGMRSIEQQPTHLQQTLLTVVDELESLDDESLTVKVDEAIDLAIEARWFRIKP